MSERERLPEDRTGTTTHFTILTREESQDGIPSVREVKGYITANTYPDGRLGEIFVRVGKAGSTEAWLDMWAVSCSIALQLGATVDELFSKFVGQRFEPSGSVKWLNGMTRCTSVVDMVAKYLLEKFGEKHGQ
jgi:ribonucleoside-diphosphate reductase alpha chain